MDCISKNSNTSSAVNLEWMNRLRDGSNKRGPAFRKDSSVNSESRDYKDSDAPNLSYIDKPKKARKVLTDNEYKGNFSDIQHITKIKQYNGSPGQGTPHVSQAIFASSLRKDSPTYSKNEKEPKKIFSLNFRKERPLIDHNYNIGS